VAYSNTPHA
jgi:hypothetical protein